MARTTTRSTTRTTARKGTSKFPIVPVAIGVAALGGLVYLLSRSSASSAVPSGGTFTARGTGPADEGWFAFVNTLLPGQTFSAYKGADDVGYSTLAPPDRARGLIRARNLQTNQEESVPLYNINRLGTGS